MTMTRVLGTSACLLLLAGAAGSGSPADVRSTATLQAQLEASRFEVCTAKCNLCAGDAGHEVNAASQDGTHGRGNHSCVVDALTCAYHTCAVSSIDPVVDIYRMVAEDDVAGLRSVLHDDNVRYVPERGVVQLLADCGAVLAQLPISEVRAAELHLD
ncbi:MAG: hypothetical protein IPJ78_02640 [Gemmatimonadetes bacterium]|nr:hypothetical protein [Gemmatimonadota bacterium]